jgi:hypothetical protein
LAPATKAKTRQVQMKNLYALSKTQNSGNILLLLSTEIPNWLCGHPTNSATPPILIAPLTMKSFQLKEKVGRLLEESLGIAWYEWQI